ncbi:MAG TPA: DNA-binding protein [Noviherbaspirillum sp.]|uniref:DNA-binding protein n=1 Tax=Noviherbaspirillum sp. TaxID=1926288 RepID=UPI002D285ADF|nr:DNA-binding protein [Noviherbaspirillum sp.]HYD94755.1 DNA-binding protein [Noviherbaspirillum sp.]
MEQNTATPRPRGSDLQQAEVSAALDALARAANNGRIPTVRAVYGYLGQRGSYTTIWRMRKPWIELYEARRRAETPLADTQSSQALLTKAATTIAAKEQRDAETIARLTDDAEALVEEAEQMEVRLKEMQQHNAALVRQRDETLAQIQHYQQANLALTALLGKLPTFQRNAVTTDTSPASVPVTHAVTTEGIEAQLKEQNAFLQQACNAMLRIDSTLAILAGLAIRTPGDLEILQTKATTASEDRSSRGVQSGPGSVQQ